jgi:hypothetical protein
LHTFNRHYHRIKPLIQNNKPNKPSKGKIHFGIVTGGGVSKPSITEKPFQQNDTVRVTGIRGGVKIGTSDLSGRSV